MATEVTYPYQSTGPSSIVANVKSRLMNGLTLDAAMVRLVVPPNPADVPYVAEKHIDFAVSSPLPKQSSGAGRLAYQVYRNITIYAFTQNLLDEAGSDEYALRSHLDFEDEIVDVMIDVRPLSLQQDSEKQGTRGFLYVPDGNEAPKRWKSDDQGLLMSILNFQIEYILRTRVLRQTS